MLEKHIASQHNIIFYLLHHQCMNQRGSGEFLSVAKMQKQSVKAADISNVRKQNKQTQIALSKVTFAPFPIK